MSDIELAIKIPEEAYNLLNTNGVDWLGAEHILDAVANGIPLPKQDKFDHQAKWLLNGLKIQINALADEKGNQLDLEDVIKIIDADKES